MGAPGPPGAEVPDTARPDVRDPGPGDLDVRELVVSLHRLLRSLRRAAPVGRLRPTELIVLSLLYERSPARIGELAAKVPCSQPTATAAIAALEGRGLVRREPDPSDGRACAVLLTARGAETLSDVARDEAEELAARLATLGADEARAVLATAPLLRRLAEAGEA
ncbi:MarR family winged helix-turn-helix transcriptional regulator [Streptomyces sp. NPDC091272]|uniref:MarR family winged helix-turn-helix transcriptional regulator n=1 Tax=Streptomyces sp. NPDC091272 TaxID=3365981 RepID=UPI00381CF4E0